MLQEIAAEASVEALKKLLEAAIEALRRKPFWVSRRVVSRLGAELDELTNDLRPCFTMGEPTSLLQVFYQLTPNRNQMWNQIHEELNIIGAWFRGWDSMRKATARRTPEVLVRELEALNSILFYTGQIGLEVSKLADQVRADDPGRLLYKVLADRYNDFVTRYERLLRRLPKEIGRLDYPPILGKERFFLRLGQ